MEIILLNSKPLRDLLHRLIHFKKFPRDTLTCIENLHCKCVSIQSSTDLFKFKK